VRKAYADPDYEYGVDEEDEWGASRATKRRKRDSTGAYGGALPGARPAPPCCPAALLPGGLAAWLPGAPPQRRP
jgi:hypothetical protein